MTSVPFCSQAGPRSNPCRPAVDEGLRTAAHDLLQSSAYAAVRRLHCEVAEAVVFMYGVVPSYFLKQMAQTLIRQLGEYP